MMTAIRKLVAQNIKAYRLQRGLSQEALADACGLHRTYIGSVERGQRNVTVESLEKIAIALAVSPKDLF